MIATHVKICDPSKKDDSLTGALVEVTAPGIDVCSGVAWLHYCATVQTHTRCYGGVISGVLVILGHQ